jgi:hypothetical protein
MITIIINDFLFLLTFKRNNSATFFQIYDRVSHVLGMKTLWQTLCPDRPLPPFWRPPRPGGCGSSCDSDQPGFRQESGEPEDMPGDAEDGPILFITSALRGNAGGEGRL